MRRGGPTFEEFSKNPDKFRGSEEDSLNQVEKGSSVFYKGVKYKYEIEGYKCKTLEEVERVAKSQGIPLRELDYRPEIIPQGGGRAEFNVKFMPKSQRDKRG
jgi:hypothetical protein